MSELTDSLGMAQLLTDSWKMAWILSLNWKTSTHTKPSSPDPFTKELDIGSGFFLYKDCISCNYVRPIEMAASLREKVYIV